MLLQEVEGLVERGVGVDRVVRLLGERADRRSRAGRDRPRRPSRRASCASARPSARRRRRRRTPRAPRAACSTCPASCADAVPGSERGSEIIASRTRPVVTGRAPGPRAPPRRPLIPATSADVRSVRFFSAETSQTRSNASFSFSASLARISSRPQKRRPRSCTHSKYETVTPPAFVRMSGRTGIARSAEDRVGLERDRAVGALGDQPAPEPSRVRRRSPGSRAPRARGCRTRARAAPRSRCARRRASPRATRAPSRRRSSSRCRGRPGRRRRRRRRRPPARSRRARRARAPRSPPRCRSPARRSAARSSFQPSRSQARAIVITTPAPVASCRNTEPPIEIGLPVTISGTAWPRCIEYVSIIHAIVCSFVAMSGAGMSSCGPMIGRSSDVNRRVSRSSSPLRHLARAAAHAALGAAVGQPQQRALPRHPHRERRALAERDLGVVADAALRRAEHARVLHAVARRRRRGGRCRGARGC